MTDNVWLIPEILPKDSLVSFLVKVKGYPWPMIGAWNSNDGKIVASMMQASEMGMNKEGILHDVWFENEYYSLDELEAWQPLPQFI